MVVIVGVMVGLLQGCALAEADPPEVKTEVRAELDEDCWFPILWKLPAEEVDVDSRTLPLRVKLFDLPMRLVVEERPDEVEVGIFQMLPVCEAKGTGETPGFEGCLPDPDEYPDADLVMATGCGSARVRPFAVGLEEPLGERQLRRLSAQGYTESPDTIWISRPKGLLQDERQRKNKLEDHPGCRYLAAC